MKEQSIEVDPKVFQVVQDKQIGAKTATADHVFFSEDATIVNSRPFDSSEKFPVVPSKVVKSTDSATASERVKVDLRSSDCARQKGDIDKSSVYFPVDVKFLPPAADDLSTSVLDYRKGIVEKV